jgi:hypothetical protein
VIGPVIAAVHVHGNATVDVIEVQTGYIGNGSNRAHR